MAALDSDANEIVIRLVYDGPALAGKTTSLRALAGSLTETTISSEEDDSGRTLWFDWLEYVGGRFEGCRIRCQTLSVPGQREFAARRRWLLDGADVIVFVADTSTDAAWQRSAEHLHALTADIASAPEPRPGIVFQANKRDVPGAIGLDVIRAQLAGTGAAIGLVESIAADGTGLREAFVYAVRLALDRVRELMATTGLPPTPPVRDSADNLLARMRRELGEAPSTAPPVVAASTTSLANTLLQELLDYERGVLAPAPAANGGIAAPRPPDATVPSGAIWPPVEGRAILHEISQHQLTARRLATGDWAAGLGTGWRVVSRRDAVFATLDQGRSALIQWARLHALSMPMISPRRCIVLATAGDGTWRQWQIVRAEESLRDSLVRAVEQPQPELVIERLCRVAQLLIDADDRLAGAPCPLACSLDSVGVADGCAVYIGLMPEAATLEPGTELPSVDDGRAPDPIRLLTDELVPHLTTELANRREDLHGALARVPRRYGHSDAILHALARVLP